MTTETTEPMPRDRVINNLRCFAGPWERTYRTAADLLSSDLQEIDRLRAFVRFVEQFDPRLHDDAWRAQQ